MPDAGYQDAKNLLSVWFSVYPASGILHLENYFSFNCRRLSLHQFLTSLIKKGWGKWPDEALTTCDGVCVLTNIYANDCGYTSIGSQGANSIPTAASGADKSD